MIEAGNALKESYEQYKKRECCRLLKCIPKERRAKLAEEIRGMAALVDVKDSEILKVILEKLSK